MITDLNDDNAMLFAAKVYNKPFAIQAEFDEDMKRFLYIKRLLSKYHTTGVLKERLLLNHFIILYNVFGIEASSRLLALKLEEKDWPVVKPFLLFLSVLPKEINKIKGKDIYTDDITLDPKVVKTLREIK